MIYVEAIVCLERVSLNGLCGHATVQENFCAARSTVELIFNGHSIKCKVKLCFCSHQY